jgi:hypothetical protein
MQRRKLPGRSRKSFPYGASFQTRHICVKGLRAVVAPQRLTTLESKAMIAGMHPDEIRECLRAEVDRRR